VRLLLSEAGTSVFRNPEVPKVGVSDYRSTEMPMFGILDSRSAEFRYFGSPISTTKEFLLYIEASEFQSSSVYRWSSLEEDLYYSTQ